MQFDSGTYFKERELTEKAILENELKILNYGKILESQGAPKMKPSDSRSKEVA